MANNSSSEFNWLSCYRIVCAMHLSCEPEARDWKSLPSCDHPFHPLLIPTCIEMFPVTTTGI